MSNWYNYQWGQFFALTLRNPDPKREATRTFSKTLDAAEQNNLMLDCQTCLADITVHEEDTVAVEATIFVRSKTDAASGRRLCESDQR